MHQWVALVFANLCLITVAQSPTAILTVHNSSSLVELSHGHRSLASLLITPGPGLPTGFLTEMNYSFVTTPFCSGPFISFTPANSDRALLDVTSLAPATYHLCFNGVLQTTASPWLVIKPGGGALTPYYWCGNWSAQAVIPPPAFAIPLPGNFIALPNSAFPALASADYECVLLFHCDYCIVDITAGGLNVETFLPPGALVVEPASSGLTYSQPVRLQNNPDVVFTVQTRGSGSAVVTTSYFTFRLLATVSYGSLQGGVPACARQRQEGLDLTVQFGRDIPVGAALLIVFPVGMDLVSTAKLQVTFGVARNVWKHTLQSVASEDFFILPLLGTTNNTIIPANTDVFISFPKGVLSALSIYDTNSSKISIGAYYPLLPVEGGGQVPIDFAVNPRDTDAQTRTFAQPYILAAQSTMPNVQSVTCDRSWSITFFAPTTLDFNDHILVSFAIDGAIQFNLDPGSNNVPLGFEPVTSFIGQESTLFTDVHYQQLFYANITRDTCGNLTLTWPANSTFCSPQMLGQPISNVTLTLLDQGVVYAQSDVGTVFIYSPAPTQQPTTPTASPTTTKVLRPCPTVSDFQRMNSGRASAPSCEVDCNISNVALKPPLIGATVLCGLSDPDAVSAVGTRPENSNPPEPDEGVRVTEVLDIFMVDSNDRVLDIPSGSALRFELPYINQDEYQKAVWRTKNVKYARLSCEFYDRNRSVWSDKGCRLISRAEGFDMLGAERKGGACECNHTTEFAIIARYVPCNTPYIEWIFGAIYSLCTFFTLVQLIRVLMSPREGKCDILLIHHLLLVVVGVLRAVGMFARCSMSPEVRVFFASLPYAILFAQFLLISLLWAAGGTFSKEQNPFTKLRWLFVIGSILTVVFTLVLPGLVVLDIYQDGHSTVAIFASYAIGGLDFAICLCVLALGSRFAWLLRGDTIFPLEDTRSRKFSRVSIFAALIFMAEAALWAFSVDEFSLATFDPLDSVYRACDIIAFLLLLSMFLSAVTVRSKSAPSSSGPSRSGKIVPTPRGPSRNTEMSSSRQGSRIS